MPHNTSNKEQLIICQCPIFPYAYTWLLKNNEYNLHLSEINGKPPVALNSFDGVIQRPPAIWQCLRSMTAFFPSYN